MNKIFKYNNKKKNKILPLTIDIKKNTVLLKNIWMMQLGKIGPNL